MLFFTNPENAPNQLADGWIEQIVRKGGTGLTIEEKLVILGEAARYDVSCSSSGSARLSRQSSSSSRQGSDALIGNTATGGICHSWTDDGRCVSLLKVLLTNHCEYNCSYCLNRRDNDHPRAAFTPRELATLTIEFYKRNYIEGLFLSSGVVKSPDHTMQLLIETIFILRNEFLFGGYIHVKTIPGASQESVYQLGCMVDRMSVNVEFCSSQALALLAPEKKPGDIVTPMAFIRDKKNELFGDKKYPVRSSDFVPAGQSTQMIIGAVRERDYHILSLSQTLYQEYNMKRVYYSAYIPVNTHPNLPAVTSAPPLLREHRLYQADWLLRFYHFDAHELVTTDHPDLDLEMDPKCGWAMRHLDIFPVEINRAEYEILLRVPGIGVLSAKRVLAARRTKKLSLEDAKKLGIVMKRAVFFITCDGKYGAPLSLDADGLRGAMADKRGKRMISPFQMRLEDLDVLRV